MVRSDHDEGLVKISLRSAFHILRWQKEEEERHKKEEVSQLRLLECWPSFVGHLFLAICRVFIYAVIHTKRRTCLVLRSRAIHIVGTV